jgi:hypothetical protein
MRRTSKQLQEDANETNRFREQRQRLEIEMTPDRVERLESAVYGSTYTDPEITASIGLSDVPIDARLINEHTARRALETGNASSNRENLVKPRNRAMRPTPTARQWNLLDLLQTPNLDFNIRRQSQPYWWDEVDPGGLWRNLEVPEITDAKQLLNLQEAQVIKLFLSKTEEQWKAIPGMQTSKDAYTSVDGKLVRNPGSFVPYEDLGTKFPYIKEMLDARLEANNLSRGEIFAANLQGVPGRALQYALPVIQSPFKLMSFIVPDRIGSESMGVSLNIKDITEPVAGTLRGITKTAGAGFLGVAQAAKTTLEQVIMEDGKLSPSDILNVLNPGDLGSSLIDIMKDPQKRAKFQQGVVEGNILTQIARRAINPNQEVDLGGGYFPEGIAATEALKNRDASLPQIGGQSFTVGRALIEPLIQEGYIDRNSYSASVMSGIVDAFWTGATDPGVYYNPVKSIKSLFSLSDVAASAVGTGRLAEVIEDVWAAERRAAGLSPTPKYPIIEGRVALAEQARFGGYLPPGTVLPQEIDDAIKAIANTEIEKWKGAGNSLSAVDSPPGLNLPEVVDEATRLRRLHGVIDLDDGAKLFDPMKIDEMPYTFDGRRTLTKLGEFKNVGEMYDAFLGNIPIGLAYKIQEAVDLATAAGRTITTKEIHTILREGVLSGDPLYNIRQVPGLLKQVINQTGKQTAYWASGHTRQFSMMPKATFFSFEDPISSINDMKRLMEIMNVPKADKHVMLSAVIKAAATGDVGTRFDLAKQFHTTIITPALKAKGVPDEWIANVAKFEGATDGIYQWSMDAIGDGYPITWFDDGTGQVLRSTDLMAKGFMMVNPKHLKQVIRETSNLWKLYQPFRGTLINEKSVYNQLVRNLEKVQVQYLKPIALGAPLPIRMVTRILPDEMLRLSAAGDMSLATILSGMSNGALNYTTAGKLIVTAKKMEKLIVKLDDLDSFYKKLDDAVAAGDTILADEYKKLIASAESDYGTRKEIKKLLSTYNQRAETLVPGMSRNVAETAQGLFGQERLDPRVMVYERSRVMEHARKDVDEFGRVITRMERNADGDLVEVLGKANENWVTGTARDIVHMSQTPEYVEVAKAMLAGGRDAVALLPERFLTGDLKPVFDRIYDKMVQTQGAQSMRLAATPINTIEGASIWVETILNDIATRTALDGVAVGAIASGEIGGKAISRAPSWTPNSRFEAFNVYEASKEFKDFVTRELLKNPDSPIVAPFSRSVGTENVQNNTRLLTQLFSLYRDTSQKFARTPLQQYSKWQRVIELIPAMDPKEAAKMVAALEKTDIDQWVKKSARLELPRAQGTATAKEVELLGEMYGHQRVDDVLYNFENRTYAGYKHNLMFAFFDAWKEQWQVWGRAIANNPSLIEKARLLKEGLTNVELPEWAGLNEGQGILYKDSNGNQAVALPLSKPVLNLLGLNASESMSAKGLSIIGTGVPGLFGVGGIVFDSFIPKTESAQAFRSLLFPVGDPNAKSRIADYLIPAWAQGVGVGVVLGADQFTNLDLADNLSGLIGSEQNDQLRASTINAVLTNISSNSGDVPRTAAEQKALLEEAHTKADLLIFIKGLFRIVLPTSSMTTYYTEIGEENLASAHIMDDFRKITDEAPSYYEGVTTFLDKYGENVWAFLAGSTTAQPGVIPTKEYAEWQTKNRSVLDEYPLVGGFLGPQTGEYDPKAFTMQRIEGQRSPADVKKRQDAALNKLAQSIVKQESRKFLKQYVDAGYTESQIVKSNEYRLAMSQKIDEVQREFPMYKSVKEKIGESETSIKFEMIEIGGMVADPNITKTTVGKALLEYWNFRETKLAQLKLEDNPAYLQNKWRQNSRNEPMRANLNQMGVYLVYTYPEFKNLWENVLSQEFLPPEEEEMVEK